MFPDSRISQSFRLGADKIRYAVNFGIAPYLLRSLLFRRESSFLVLFLVLMREPLKLTCEMDPVKIL